MPSLAKVWLNRVHVPPYRLRGGDEVLPGVDDRQQRRGDRRQAAGEGQARRAAVQRRQTLFQHVGGGVHQAGVDVAELAQAEEVGRVLGVVKHIAGRGVNRHGAGGRRGVGRLSGMDGQRAEAPRNRLESWVIGQGLSSRSVEESLDGHFTGTCGRRKVALVVCRGCLGNPGATGRSEPRRQRYTTLATRRIKAGDQRGACKREGLCAVQSAKYEAHGDAKREY